MDRQHPVRGGWFKWGGLISGGILGLCVWYWVVAPSTTERGTREAGRGTGTPSSPSSGTRAETHFAPRVGALTSAGARPSTRPIYPLAVDAGPAPVSGRRRSHPEPAPDRAGKVIPHPMGVRREQDRAQHQFFSEVQQALDARDYAAARALLLKHDSQFAEGAWLDAREAYQLILDCLESSSTEAKARGVRFVSQQAGSPHRRKVRRACQVQ